MDIFNSWPIYLVGDIVFFVIFLQYYKLAVKDTKKDGAATVVLQIIAALTTAILIPLYAWQVPNSWIPIALVVAASVFYAIQDRLQTTVRKNLPVSTYSIVGQLTNVAVIISGIVVFNEAPTSLKLLGAALILLGNVLLFFKKDKFVFNRYLLLAVLAALIFAVATTLDIGNSENFNLPFYISITLFIPAVFLMIGERTAVRELKGEFNKARKYYTYTGIAWGLAIFCSLRAFQLGPVTTIVPLAASSVLLNVIIAFFFHDEREQKTRKVISALLVIAGITLTVISV